MLINTEQNFLLLFIIFFLYRDYSVSVSFFVFYEK